MKQRYYQLKTTILNKLEAELPKRYYYHSFSHTMDMHDSAARIADFEKIEEDDKEIILVAALFHDAGFIIGRENHESHSCSIAKELLPQYDYAPSEIDAVCNLIMATQMPVKPKNKLEEIICDADLDYLGRDDFKAIGNLLYRELSEEGTVEGLDAWNQIQIRFLNNHRYYTTFSQNHREATKQENLKRLMEG
jgi:predicted metal-dependent HD superfamily phosphohydrolase